MGGAGPRSGRLAHIDKLALSVVGVLLALTLGAAADSRQTVAASAAAPGARAGAGTPTLFGFNDNWAHRKQRVDYARDARADVIRFPLTWSYVQPEPGVWIWTKYDRLYERTTAMGIRLIFSPQDSPCWARPALGCDIPGAAPPGRRHLDDYAAFVRTAVARYPRTAAVEAWNEPNLAFYWRPKPQPRRYARLLRVVDRAVNAVDRRMPVLFGGLSAGDTNIRAYKMAHLRFFQRVIAAGAKRRFDGVGFHSYGVLPKMMGMLRGLRDRLEKIGRGRAPLWVTETGVSSYRIGELNQAVRLRKRVRRLAQEPLVRAVVIHRMFDSRTAQQPFRSIGVVRADGERKPAFCAVANLGRREACRRLDRAGQG